MNIIEGTGVIYKSVIDMDNVKIIFKLLRYTGTPFLIREILQRKKVTMLLFHDIDPIKCENQFKVLRKKYNIISLKEYFDSRENNTFKSLPSKSLIITIDDGNKNNYLLKPILKKYNIPVTIFLCAGIVGTNKHFWFSHNLNKRTIEELKNLPNSQRLNFLNKYGYTEEKEFCSRQALSKDEIENLKEFVDFQSHTIYHPILPKCTEKEAQKEITLSKKYWKKSIILKHMYYHIQTETMGKEKFYLLKRQDINME